MYRVGMVVPPAKPRLGLQSGPAWPPTWFCLTVAPQRERATRDHLRACGIVAFYPSEERIYHVQGKKRAVERPLIPGHLYACFRAQPQWEVLKRRDRLITGVFCANGVPVEIHPDIIRRLRGLTVEAEKLREAKAEMRRRIEEARRPNIGDGATISEGPLAGLEGFVVDVTSEPGVVWLDTLLGKVKVKRTSLEKRA